MLILAPEDEGETHGARMRERYQDSDYLTLFGWYNTVIMTQ